MKILLILILPLSGAPLLQANEDPFIKCSVPITAHETAAQGWNSKTLWDTSAGDALCIPVTLVMTHLLRVYKNVPFKNLPPKIQDYLVLAKLFSVQRTKDSFGVPIQKVYSLESQKLPSETLEALRKKVNQKSLELWKEILMDLKDPSLTALSQKAFPYKKGLLSLPNASALYALFYYAEKYNIPIGIEWHVVKLKGAKSLEGLPQKVKIYSVDSGVLKPVDCYKTHNQAFPLIRMIVVLDGKEETLLQNVFKEKNINQIIQKQIPYTHLYKGAAVADLADFDTPEAQKDVVESVSTPLPFMKVIYQEAHKLQKQMQGADDYMTFDKKTYRFIPIVRLDHAYMK